MELTDALKPVLGLIGINLRDAPELTRESIFNPVWMIDMLDELNLLRECSQETCDRFDERCFMTRSIVASYLGSQSASTIDDIASHVQRKLDFFFLKFTTKKVHRMRGRVVSVNVPRAAWCFIYPSESTHTYLLH